MIWTLLWGTVAGIGALMVCVVTIYWYEFGMVRVTRGLRRRPRRRLWFHAWVRSPREFRNFDHRVNYFGKGIDAVWGVADSGRRHLQSVRFSSKYWTSRAARNWLNQNNYPVIGFHHVKS